MWFLGLGEGYSFLQPHESGWVIPPQRSERSFPFTSVSHDHKEVAAPIPNSHVFYDTNDSVNIFRAPSWQLSRDAIGWGRKINYTMDHRCLKPPPFGVQCTVPAEIAEEICRAVPQCVAVVCPDTLDYIPTVSPSLRRLGVKGHVCLLREGSVRNERNHRMCRPRGCRVLEIAKVYR